MVKRNGRNRPLPRFSALRPPRLLPKRGTLPITPCNTARQGAQNMIGRLNHVAIAVPDLEAASAQYRGTLGAKVSPPQDEPDHGVTVVFIELPNTKIELLYPLGDNSPIKGFLEKNPSGGIHHICYEVDDILAARDHLKASGARVLGTGEPKIGAHGKPVLFLHPKDFNGCLVELEQV
jgi:methylmalonyl-CoA/ethylmalonyl-CoA epimerase